MTSTLETKPVRELRNMKRFAKPVEVKVRYGTRIIIATWHTVSHVMSATTMTDSNEVTKKIVGQKLAYVDFLSYYCRKFGLNGKALNW